MFGKKKTTTPVVEGDSGTEPYIQNVDPLAATSKTKWERLWPAMACGSGLFSDGYINNVRKLSQPGTYLTIPNNQ